MTRASVIARRHTGEVHDVQDVTVRYLMYGLLPVWTVPAAADWVVHRRTRIEHTTGVRESLIHLLMMAEIGLVRLMPGRPHSPCPFRPCSLE